MTSLCKITVIEDEANIRDGVRQLIDAVSKALRTGII